MRPEEQYQEIKMIPNSIVQKILRLYDDKVMKIKNFNLKEKI